MDVQNMMKSISEGTPTPGGGAVGWIALGQGTALLRMVSNLTLKSKKWAVGHEQSRAILKPPQNSILVQRMVSMLIVMHMNRWSKPTSFRKKTMIGRGP